MLAEILNRVDVCGKITKLCFGVGGRRTWPAHLALDLCSVIRGSWILEVGLSHDEPAVHAAGLLV